MFRDGQKVVCINDDFPKEINKLYISLPKKGKQYTIRDVCPGQNFKLEPEIAVTLQEIHNPKGKGGLERSFNSERFEPLEELNFEKEEEIELTCHE